MLERSEGPRIGITVRRRARAVREQRRNRRNAAAYRRSLELAGARVVELPPEGEVGLEELQAILLTGGGDVDPGRYGQAPHCRLGPVDRIRDEFELCLARLALGEGIPVLGICRGAQVLGIATGGQLLQDIASQTRCAHKHAPGPGERTTHHWVRIAEGSRLREIVGAAKLRVNSHHHQANAVLGPRMRPVAWSQDGVIEAIEGVGEAFVMGVQWHPERMPRAPRQRQLIAAFLAAARNRGGS